jgi:hypothetical protein
MSRFKVLTLAAVLALGSLSFATEASARGGHGGHGGAHWAGGHFGGHLGGHFGALGFRRGFGFRGSYYASYPYAGCWSWQRAWTPYGWRLHHVNVCYYPYY